MKFSIPKEWLEKRAAREATHEIGAGLPEFWFAGAATPQASANLDEAKMAAELRVAFGRFIGLMRRSRGWSMEKLANAADVDIGELVTIEEDIRYVPEPSTVYQLATIFSLPAASLMQLAGLAIPKDQRFVQAAVRFAAKSESMAKLTTEERAALDMMVGIINEKKPT